MSNDFSVSKLLKLTVAFALGGLWLSAGACSSDSGDDEGTGGAGGTTSTSTGGTGTGTAAATGGATGSTTTGTAAATGGATSSTTTAAACLSAAGVDYQSTSHYLNKNCANSCTTCHTAEPTCSCADLAACNTAAVATIASACTT